MSRQDLTKEISVEQADPRDAEVSALLQQSHALMQALFSPDENHFLSIDELCAPDVTLFVARIDGRAVGTGALALREGYGEVKSMFTDKNFRGYGVAGALLTRIEEAASAHNLPYLRLETGDLLHEAHRLYVRHDFKDCGPFGDYDDSDASIFMEKVL